MEINNYFNYEPRFNGVFSINNLSRIRDGAYDINLGDKNDKGTLIFIFYWQKFICII